MGPRNDREKGMSDAGQVSAACDKQGQKQAECEQKVGNLEFLCVHLLTVLLDGRVQWEPRPIQSDQAVSPGLLIVCLIFGWNAVLWVTAFLFDDTLPGGQTSDCSATVFPLNSDRCRPSAPSGHFFQSTICTGIPR